VQKFFSFLLFFILVFFTVNIISQEKRIQEKDKERIDSDKSTIIAKGSMGDKKNVILNNSARKDDQSLDPNVSEKASKKIPQKEKKQSYNPLQKYSDSRIDQKKKKIIVLDPGHGGPDDGASGLYGLLEKEFVLDVSLKVKALVDEYNTAKSEKKIELLLTREEDIFLSLSERTEFANKYNADIFISLHSNASPKKDAYGLEVFYLDSSGDKAARRLAMRENLAGSDRKANHTTADDDLDFMLSDLIQSSKKPDSILLAKTLNTSLISVLSKTWKRVRTLGVKKAPFYVLVGAHMPCILIELFFIDNQNDAEMMKNSAFRKEVAKGIFEGIVRYSKEED
jgi:N-acetylmuramoyl-L-alanine amidase